MKYYYFIILFFCIIVFSNSIIGQTFRVNASAGNTDFDYCWLQSNRTGTWQNESMTINGDSCYIQFTGLSNTKFLYNVISNNTEKQNTTETRTITINNVGTSIKLNSPANN